MKSVLGTYDRYLKGVASVRPAQRTRAIYGVMFPWMLVATAGGLLVSLLGLPRGIGTWIFTLSSLLGIAGLIYAGWRFVHHGVLFDQTPADPALREMPGGDALIQALRRATLNSLTDVTLSTRLRADLKLTRGMCRDCWAFSRRKAGWTRRMSTA